LGEENIIYAKGLNMIILYKARLMSEFGRPAPRRPFLSPPRSAHAAQALALRVGGAGPALAIASRYLHPCSRPKVGIGLQILRASLRSRPYLRSSLAQKPPSSWYSDFIHGVIVYVHTIARLCRSCLLCKQAATFTQWIRMRKRLWDFNSPSDSPLLYAIIICLMHIDNVLYMHRRSE
jgi:hypothetical protein